MKIPKSLRFGLVLVLLFAAAITACAPSATPTPVPTAMPAPTMAPTAAPTTPSTSNAAPQTFTVLVGTTDTSTGADLEAYFPGAIHVHVGDTVTWKLKSTEIHTVTFLGGEKMPDFIVSMNDGKPTDIMLNPQAALPAAPKDNKYDGTTFVNSGIMGPDQGQAQQFSLTFTKVGTYPYVCTVHTGEKMAGTVVVEESSAKIPTQAEDDAQGKKEMDALMAQIPSLEKAADGAIKPDQKNADGTMTHYVTVGFSQGQIDMETYFPQKLTVHPGDTVVWTPSSKDIAPHTITFLNGAKVPDTITPQPQPKGPPILEINPTVVLPENVDKTLTKQGIYNSGLIDPSMPGPHTFSLKIGNISGDVPYLCILHDDNGMKGTLTVTQ